MKDNVSITEMYRAAAQAFFQSPLKWKFESWFQFARSHSMKKIEEALIVPEKVFFDIIEKSIKTYSHRSSIDETYSNGVEEGLQQIFKSNWIQKNIDFADLRTSSMTWPAITQIEEEKFMKLIKDDTNHEYTDLPRINRSEKEIPLAQDKRPNYHDQSWKRAERAKEEHTQPVLH